MTTYKYCAAVVAAVTLVGLTALPAHADSTPASAPQTTPVTATVIGGGLSASVTGPASALSVALNGTTAQIATSSSVSPWTIVDARGTGAPWGISVSGTDFISAAGDTETVQRVMPISALSITPGSVTATSGSTVVPTGSVLALTNTPQVLVTAAADAKGSFSLEPKYTLTVPGSAYRSNYTSGTSGAMNAYTTTLTFTIA